MYGGTTTKQELEQLQEETEMNMMDPYIKKKQRFLKEQQFRKINVGPEDLLNNGQKV